MNKIVSSALAGLITSTVALSAADAVVGVDVPTADRLSNLYITDDTYDSSVRIANLDGNTSEVSVDFATGIATPVQIVWNSFVNLTSGSKFTLRTTNSNFALSQEAVLCTFDDATFSKIGSMVSVGDTDGSTTMNNMSFRIDDNIDAAALNRENNVTFISGNTCEAGATPLSLISTSTACTDISIEIPQAIDDSSQAFTDYTAPAIKVAETKRLVQVACDVPVCTIDATTGNKDFTTTPTASGINNAIAATAGDLRADEYCPECDETTTATCTTTITIKSSATDFNITALSVTPVFTDGGNADMKITLAADGNVSGEANDTSVIGGLVTLTDLNITQEGGEHNITVTYTPTTDSVIAEGTVTGNLVFTASNGKTLLTDREALGSSLATFAAAGKTQFTVPYMNTNYKSMAKVTSLSDSEATISAVITDQDGVSSPSIDLGTIAAGATGFYFSTHGALREGADAAGIKNAWSVVFTINAEATVVATMKGPDGGDRAISVF